MAKVYTETLVIKMSKLIKDNSSTEKIVNDEITTNFETIVQELVGENVIVEIEEA